MAEDLESRVKQLEAELALMSEREEERDRIIIQMQRKSSLNKQTADSAMYGLLCLVGFGVAIMVGLRVEGSWGSFDGKTVIDLLSLPAIASAAAIVGRMIFGDRSPRNSQ